MFKTKRILQFVISFLRLKINWWKFFIYIFGILFVMIVVRNFNFRNEIFLRIVERFCNSVSDALFWVLIIFAVAIAGSWVYKQVVDFLLGQMEKKEEEKKKEKEENE